LLYILHIRNANLRIMSVSVYLERLIKNLKREVGKENNLSDELAEVLNLSKESVYHFIHSPAITYLLFALIHVCLNQWAELEHPSLDSRMIHFHSSDS
jgi:hypothetical protein